MLALIALFLAGAKAPQRAELYVGGGLVRTFSDFQLIGHTVFLPLSESADALGIEASADERSRTVFLRTRQELVIVDSSQKKVAVGTSVSPIQHAPVWTPDNVYLPEQVFTRVIAGLMRTSIEIKAASGVSHQATKDQQGRANHAGHNSSRDPVDVIVIDPGHGGRDCGARGPEGILEKDVTLAISAKLKKRLQDDKDIKAMLTRDKDVYVPLSKRPRIARQHDADLFVSIHANGYERISAHGFETFFASLTATDQAALDLARWENQVAETGDHAPDEVRNDIEMILGDMAQTEYLAESQRFAELVQEEMARVMDTDNRGVKQAPFQVLMDSTMPAVLVEVGFITSPAEARMITHEHTQELIVKALAQAIQKYRQQANARLGLAP